MYESFFGLKDLPFRLTPDPAYLFMSGKHREAFAHLLYGVNEGSGFVAVTGEVGAGKTTLLRALLRETGDDVATVYIVNPVLTSTELLQTVNAELGLPSGSSSRKELLEGLNHCLRRRAAAGGRTVVIVDEAQNLDPVVLEQLRLLSNLETETEKLIQIVLAGQPELRELLERHDLRQLNQRVTVRWHLDTLDAGESAEYIRHRLSVAGATAELFESKALDLVHHYAQGVPRLINIIAHRSLLVAYTRSAGRVGPSEVDAAASELGHGRGPVRAPKRRWLVAAAALLVMAAAGLAVSLKMAPLSGLEAAMPGFFAAPAARPTTEKLVAPPSATPAGDALGKKSVAARTRKERRERLRSEAAEAASSPVSGAAPAETRREPFSTADDVGEAAQGEVARVRPGFDSAATPASPELLSDTDLPLTGSEGAPRGLDITVPGAAAGPAVVRGAGGLLPPVALLSEDVAARLAAAPPFDTALAGVNSLLESWEAPRLTAAETETTSLDLESIAAARELRYFAPQPTLALIRRLDLPAVLELQVPGGGLRHVMIDQVDAAATSLRTYSGLTIARASLDLWWNGRAHVIWRDAESLAVDFGPGSGGPAVRRLQQLLTEVGVYQGSADGRYDEVTEQSVRRFQAAHQVVPDGVAGPVTQILLYNSLRRFDRPTLSPGNDRRAPVDGP